MTWSILSTGSCKPKGGGRWEAFIKASGRIQYIGRFDDEEAAARAFDEKAKQLRVNPILNFLPKGSLNPDRKSTYVEWRRKHIIDVSVVSHFPV